MSDELDVERLAQFAMDWDRIVKGWQDKLAVEMDAAYKEGDPARYQLPALLHGEMRSARELMLSMVTFPAGRSDRGA